LSKGLFFGNQLHRVGQLYLRRTVYQQRFVQQCIYKKTKARLACFGWLFLTLKVVVGVVTASAGI
jgi:hypothetical protein